MRRQTNPTCNIIESICRIFHGQKKFVFQAVLLSLSSIESTSAVSLATGDAQLSSWNANETLILGALMGIALLGFFIFTCMDCMNSEVSTESHPASTSNPKWGGANNYNRGVGGGTDACYVSEVINPDDLRNAPLPYSMVPTQIPETGEFRGYQSGGGMVGYSQGPTYQEAGFANNSASAPSGYGANLSSGAGGGDQVRGRNYNPVDQEDRPPAYSEAIHR